MGEHARLGLGERARTRSYVPRRATVAVPKIPAAGFFRLRRTQVQACRTQPHPGFQDSPPFFRARLICLVQNM